MDENQYDKRLANMVCPCCNFVGIEPDRSCGLAVEIAHDPQYFVVIITWRCLSSNCKAVWETQHRISEISIPEINKEFEVWFKNQIISTKDKEISRISYFSGVQMVNAHIRTNEIVFC